MAKELKIASCRGCNADIVWFHNPKTNRIMPVNAETVEIGDEQLDLTRHISHFATCPKANDFRRAR